MLSLVLALIAQAADPRPDDIVVEATPRGRCRIRMDQQPVSDREFGRRVEGWPAGKPVRVVARRSADLKCLTRITFKLADRGITLIEFVEPARPPATP